MKEIGGYPELELNIRREYYTDALKLNSGRNALFYILKAYRIKRILIPYYICNSVLEPIKKLGIKHSFYNITDEFKPLISRKQIKNDFILCVNYFGICEEIVKNLAEEYTNLIIDNSQAFFSKPIISPTFYSPRKFFGVPDGAYLFTDQIINQEIEQDKSYKRCSHLLKRLDCNSQNGYEEYKNIEEAFSNIPLKFMSNLTERILKSIDYDFVKKTREKNFSYLHENLKELNELKLHLNNLNGPLKYPFLIKNEKLKSILIKNKIYISTYWQEVLNRVDNEAFEYYLTKYLIPIPIDQRYNINDMKIIIEKINDTI